MKKNIYSVFDQKARLFLKVLEVPCRGVERHDEIVRSFADVVRSPQSAVNAHPEDYSLYFLAQFDDETGRFENIDVPILLAHASEFSMPASPAPALPAER